MSPERFKAVMATLAVTLPGKEQSDALRDVYWRTLADLTDAQLETAAARALRSCRFFPTPSELLELSQPRNLGAEAGRVFNRVKMLAEYSALAGTYWTETKIRLALGDQVADAFQAAGGSAAFEKGDEVWTRKAFVEAYQEFPPPENPLLRIGSGDTKALSAPKDARVIEFVQRIGKPIEPPPMDEKRAAYIDAATDKAHR